MRLKSTSLGITILIIVFGGILTTSALGMWQTQGGGVQNHGGEGEAISIISLAGAVSEFDSTRFEIIADDGQIIPIEIGNSHYIQSIGFAPQVGERVRVDGFWDENGGFSAITVTRESTGWVYPFRDASGHPLWAGKGQGNGNQH
ncbi:MAG: hypothetical protein C4583_05990 [Anaerolineaceae bacterium]|nr:MAG: hypothetical protein C4583_05990 [Anaerolineaceae bacterium]